MKRKAVLIIHGFAGGVYRGGDRSGRGRYRGVLALRSRGAGLPRHAGKVRRGRSCRNSAARRRQYRRRQAGFRGRGKALQGHGL